MEKGKGVPTDVSSRAIKLREALVALASGRLMCRRPETAPGRAARRWSRNEHLVSRTKVKVRARARARARARLSLGRKKGGFIRSQGVWVGGARDLAGCGEADPPGLTRGLQSVLQPGRRDSSQSHVSDEPFRIAASGRCSYCSYIAATCRALRPSHPHAQAQGDTRCFGLQRQGSRRLTARDDRMNRCPRLCSWRLPPLG
jgi:hypothetical protein